MYQNEFYDYKNNIDADAEREANAISKLWKTLPQRRLQGIRNNQNKSRLRSEHDYNKVEFDKLFRS